MPKRTNERQQVIEMIKRLNARPTCKVTASKMLTDTRTGQEREVDVTVEEEIDGHIFTQCVEITSQKRPVDLVKVEQLIKKHETLPTDRLAIVSWSGFTQSARDAIEVNPRVMAVEPTVEEGPNGPVVRNLMMDTVTLDAEIVVCIVHPPHGEPIRVPMMTDNDTFDAEERRVGSMADAVNGILQDPAATAVALQEAHAHPDRESVSHYVLTKDLGDEGGLYLRHETSDELHRIKAIEITGPITLGREELNLEVRWLEQKRFAHGKTRLADGDALVVAALGEGEQVTGLGVVVSPSAPRAGPDKPTKTR